MDRAPPKLQPPESLPYVPASPRSPDKQPTTPHEFDPLLNLSPATVIDLLRGADAEDPQDALHDLLRDVSAAERAFGLRAAVAAKKINEWCSELLGWQWPGTFEHPMREAGAEGVVEGSMPAQVVAHLERRVEAIKDEYDELDLEELKGFVRNAHLTPGSRGSSMYEVDFMALSQFQRLDDFTALVTATIMHALPYLQRLRRLLDVWSLRLLVLHQVPGFLADLDATRAAVNAAWKAIGYGTATERPRISRDAFQTMRSMLHTRVAELGIKIDAMLDQLEGQEDRLPDHWIDDMESVQADCENWVVVAQHEIEEGEWRERYDLDDTSVANGKRAAEPADRLVGAEEIASPAAATAESTGTDSLFRGDSTNTGPHKPSPIALPTAQEASGLSPPESAASSSFSDVSEAHIMDASPMQLIRSPIEEKSFFQNRNSILPEDMPRRASEHTVASMATVTGKDGDAQLNLLAPHAGAESVASSLDGLSEEVEAAAPERPVLNRTKSHLSRASVASIEIVPRKDVRNITITRSSSNASRRTNNQSKDEDLIVRTSTPSGLKHETHSTEAMERRVQPPSPSPEPASLHISKRRNRSPVKVISIEHDPEQEDEFYHAVDSVTPPKHSQKEPKTLEDQLAARIGSILSNIPANIRLKSGLEDETTEGKRITTSQPVRTVSAQPAARSSRSVTPGLILAPVAEKSSKPKAHQDQSGIKLYHLHQPDREHPIKLYVRLVGEGGERVMVRVGGGWADLGEYLKEYALHHGHRSVSDGKFGVLGIRDTDQNMTPWVHSIESGRVTPDRDSPLVNRKARASSGVSDAAPHTPEVAVRYREETPASMESAQSGSHLEEDSPLGLAGPKNKDVELSPKKRAWVNGMLNQARQVSAEKKKSNLSELGKVGSTRRFFKGKGGV